MYTYDILNLRHVCIKRIESYLKIKTSLSEINAFKFKSMPRPKMNPQPRESIDFQCVFNVFRVAEHMHDLGIDTCLS